MSDPPRPSLSALKQSVLSRKKAVKPSPDAEDAGEPVSVSELLDEAASLEDQAERYGMSGAKARARLEASWAVLAGRVLAERFGWTVLGLGGRRAAASVGDERLPFEALYNAARTAELLATFEDPPTRPAGARLDLLEAALLLSELAARLADAMPANSPTEQRTRLANLADAHFNHAQALRSLADELDGIGRLPEGPVPVSVGAGLPFAVNMPRERLARTETRLQLVQTALEHLKRVYALQEERAGLETTDREAAAAAETADETEDTASAPGTPSEDAMDEDVDGSEGGEEEAVVLEPVTPEALVDTTVTLVSTTTDLLSLSLSSPDIAPADNNTVLAAVQGFLSRARAGLTSIADAKLRATLSHSLALHEAQLGLLVPPLRPAAVTSLRTLAAELDRHYPPDLDLLLPALTDLADALLEDSYLPVLDGAPAPPPATGAEILRLLSRARALRPRDAGISASLADATVIAGVAPRHTTSPPFTPSELTALKDAAKSYHDALSILSFDLDRPAPGRGRPPTAQPSSEDPDPRALGVANRLLLVLRHVDPAAFARVSGSRAYAAAGGSAEAFARGEGGDGDEGVVRTWLGFAAAQGM
ncbi:hypothetical protein DFJ74DRAFT_769304 [Hyaloraphidium curvatum]|nr:hypothetical protein DFJ74DRAFT_769304 [Hyaloraphidium curvatum]